MEGERLEGNHMVPIIRPTRGHLWCPELVSHFPAAGARRRFTSRKGLGRCSGHFLGLVVSAAPSPFRFGFAETLVPVAMISFPRKPWESLPSCFSGCDGGGF